MELREGLFLLILDAVIFYCVTDYRAIYEFKIANIFYFTVSNGVLSWVILV